MDKTGTLLIFLALVGLGIFIIFYSSAFPTVHINLEVNRNQAEEVARNFIKKHGYSVEGYQSSTVFDIYNSSKKYIEQNMSQDQAPKIMGEKVPVWFWKVRFFKYLQKEEFLVCIDPGGKVILFQQIISDDEPRKEISLEEGKEKALRFLQSQEIDTAHLEIVDQGSIPRLERKDLTWTFRDKNFLITDKSIGRDAYLEYKITFQGDKMGYFSSYLHIPDETYIKWRKGSGKGGLLVLLGTLGTFVIIIMEVFFIHFKGRGRLRKTLPLILCISLSAVALLEGFNSLSLYKDNYDTGQSPDFFWTMTMAGILLSSILYGSFAFFGGSLGIALEETAGKEHRGPPFLVLGGKNIPYMIFMGYVSALIIMGYDVAFYLIGQKYLGVWTPLDIPYSDILSTPFPWVNALFVGFSASVVEELLFRMGAVTFLKKTTGNNYIALILPAFLWALLHCNYPQEPFFIRGIELTLVGIFLGWLYQKYGILTTIASHYCLNAVYGSTILFSSSNPYFIISGGITVILLLIPGIMALNMKKKMELGEAEVINRQQQEDEEKQKEPQKEEEQEEKTSPPPGNNLLSKVLLNPFSLSFMAKILMIILPLTALGVSYIIPPHQMGKSLKIPLDQFQATQKAREYLINKGVCLNGIMTGTQLIKYPTDSEILYASRMLGVKKGEEHLLKYLPPAVWMVNFHFDGKEESYRVLVLPDGKIFTHYHFITNNGGQGKLSPAEALLIGDQFIKEQQGNYTYSDYTERGYNNRKDFEIFYNQDEGNMGDAVLRARLLLQGNEITGFRKYYDIPDSFIKKEEEKTFRDTLSSLFFILLLGGFILWTVIYGIKKKVAGGINVKSGLKIAVPVFIIYILGRVNRMGEIWNHVSYDISYFQGISRWWLETLILSLILGIFTLFVFCLLESAYKETFKNRLPIKEWFLQVFSSPGGKDYYLWGILSGYAFLLSLELDITGLLFNDKNISFILLFNPWVSLPGGSSWVPLLEPLTESLIKNLLLWGVSALFMIMLKKISPHKSLPGVLLIIMSCMAVLPQKGTWELKAGSLLSLLLVTGVIWVFIKYIFKDNLISYLCFIWIFPLYSFIPVLFRVESLYYRINGMIIIIFFFLPLVSLFFMPRIWKTPHKIKKLSEGDTN